MCTSFSSHPPSSTASTGCQMKRGVLLKERRKLWSRHPGTDRDDWCLTYQTWIFWVNETLIILWFDISKRGGFGRVVSESGMPIFCRGTSPPNWPAIVSMTFQMRNWKRPWYEGNHLMSILFTSEIETAQRQLQTKQRYSDFPMFQDSVLQLLNLPSFF